VASGGCARSGVAPVRRRRREILRIQPLLRFENQRACFAQEALESTRKSGGSATARGLSGNLLNLKMFVFRIGSHCRNLGDGGGRRAREPWGSQRGASVIVDVGLGSSIDHVRL
jgi:hypothetical protein